MQAQINQDDFDVSSIPTDFSPLHTLDANNKDTLYAGDDKLYVTFDTRAILNPAESTKAGRPIYADTDMITVRTPGSQLTSIVDKADRYTKGRPILRAKYEAWKTGQEKAASGTPLENFPFLFTKPSLIAELKYRNIFTVEQLASLSDSGKQSIMGGHELCLKAQEWIDKTAGDAADDEKAALLERIAALEAMVQPEKPKRQRKVEAETPEFLQGT
jgi:hypothetical protein